MKKKSALLAMLLAAALFFTACAGNTATPGGDTDTGNTNADAVSNTADSAGISESSLAIADIVAQYGEDDLDSSWDESSATKITLNGASIAVDGSGAEAAGGILTITSGGVYALSGTLSDGQIMVSASDNDTVRLVLNGIDISNTTGAPIYAASADKLIVTLADGTQNTVTDGGEGFVYANTADEEPDAAVFSKVDLSFNGTGTLTVNAGFNNGIGTKDDLVIASGTYIVNAANHGIRGRDSLTVVDGNFTIEAGNDGMQANNDEDAEKGWISLKGGVYNITAAQDGIQSETAMAISGGQYTITTGGAASSSTTSDSYKGIKATTNLSISGGTFAISSQDDGLHANGSIVVSGGDFTIASGDDGVHADADLSVSGGSVNITQSYEGLEGATVNISGGTINIISSDDAINAAGGAGSADTPGMFGRDSFASSGEYYINISGGEITYMAGGDGIDSNGDVTISDGTVTAYINSTPDNGAIDCDGVFTATGGAIVYGGTGVGQTPGGSSTQSYVYIDSGVSANTEISVRKDGETLMAFTSANDYPYLAVSLPGIVSGDSYEIYSGSNLLTTITAGSGGGNGMGGGRGGAGGGGRGGRGGGSGTPPGGGNKPS